MRFKAIFTAGIPACLMLVLAMKVEAQVAPSARVGGLPLAISVPERFSSIRRRN
jgi:hypothetical protein